MQKLLTIRNCSACGEVHPDLPTRPLDPPVTIRNLLCTRYAICPQSHLFIYIAQRDTEFVNIRKPGSPDPALAAG